MLFTKSKFNYLKKMEKEIAIIESFDVNFY